MPALSTREAGECARIAVSVSGNSCTIARGVEVRRDDDGGGGGSSAPSPPPPKSRGKRWPSSRPLRRRRRVFSEKRARLRTLRARFRRFVSVFSSPPPPPPPLPPRLFHLSRRLGPWQSRRRRHRRGLLAHDVSSSLFNTARCAALQFGGARRESNKKPRLMCVCLDDGDDILL